MPKKTKTPSVVTDGVFRLRALVGRRADKKDDVPQIAEAKIARIQTLEATWAVDDDFYVFRSPGSRVRYRVYRVAALTDGLLDIRDYACTDVGTCNL